MNAKPFVKWVGGKSKLIPELKKHLPKKINRYFEPFVGGGAFFFSLKQSDHISSAVINDINNKLITTYKQIKQNPNKLILRLRRIENEYKKLPQEKRKKYFYDTRVAYNKKNHDDLYIASRLIFLNKTCFNGMYRENSKGGYNVPFGDYKNPTICDEKNIRAVSKCLKNTKISSVSFEESVKECKKGDFIYFDPPYYPVNTTSNFTSYSKNSFGASEQEKLKETFSKLHKKGCFVMLSNSSTPFIRDIYDEKDFYIKDIYAARSINSKGNKRGKIKEVFITNY